MLSSLREKIGRDAGSSVTNLSANALISLPVKLHDDLVALLEERGLSLSDWAAVMARGYLRMPSEHTLTTPLSFKKWAGETLETVIRLDPGYVRWLKGNVGGFRMDERAEKLLNEIDPGGK